MIKIDVSVFLQIVNFIFLILVLNAVLYKPVRKILLQRKEKVNGLEQSVKTFTRDAQEKDESYLGGIKEARAKGLIEKENLLQSASEEEKVIIDKINEKAQADLEAVREQITKDTRQVSVSLEKEIDSFAEAIRQKILGRAT
jgi:F-type H+-transporting ATPase subunit b